MNVYYLTRIKIGQTYGDAPPDQYQRNAKIDHPQTHCPLAKVFDGDLRELIGAAKFLVQSLEEQNLKPSGLSKLREQLDIFNLDGPKY